MTTLTKKEKDSIPEGWVFYRKRIIGGMSDIKVRRKYPIDAIQFNEDGFEYKSVFVHNEPINEYDKLKEDNERLAGDNALLIEALKIYIANDTRRNMELWCNEIEWAKINKAKELLNNIKKINNNG